MSSYSIKKINYHGNQFPIMLQNENGPCPLLAAANVLLLRGNIEIPNACVQVGEIQLEELVTILANRVLEPANNTNVSADEISLEVKQHPSYNPQLSSKLIDNNLSKTGIDVLQNDESLQRKIQQIDDLISTLPSLSKGLDLNPKFTSGPNGFEYTSNIAVFDALHIDLVHGWLIDPQGEDLYQLLNTQTYNQIMDTMVHGTDVVDEIIKLENNIEVKEAEELKVDAVGSEKDEWVNVAVTDQEDERDVKVSKDDVNSKEEVDPQAIDVSGNVDNSTTELKTKLCDYRDLAHRCHLLGQFIEDTRSQLTHFGLAQLHEYILDDALCVFFRNDHFSTLTKHNGCLYLLVTDVGYSDVSEIVWEKLDNIDGNTEYVDCNFSAQGVLSGRDMQYERELAAQIAAATQASLKDINTTSHDQNTLVSSSGTTNETSEASEKNKDPDRAFAIAMQRKYEEEQNERAARLLQDEEYARSTAAASTRQRQQTPVTPVSSCIIM